MLPDGAELDEDRTAVPLELDQIYSSVDDLTVALGPTGANKNGALSDLLESTARNFGGQGAKFHQTIEDFSKLSATLDDNKEELFGSAAELEGFISTLAEERPDRAQLQPVAGRRVHDARRGAHRARGVAQEPRRGDDPGVVVRARQPRDPRQEHQGPQPGLEGARQAARRARRDPHERPGRPEQPLPHLQPAGGDARHPGEPGPARPADRRGPRGLPLLDREPGRPERAGVQRDRAGSATTTAPRRSSGRSCRAPAPSARGRQGGPQPWQDRFDPSLGGLVEVSR